MTQAQPFEAMLDKADNPAEDKGRTDLGSLIDAFDDRAFEPVLILPGLLGLVILSCFAASLGAAIGIWWLP
jgi:hypothetical protein